MRIDLSDKNIVYLYTVLGWSTEKIAAHFRCSPGAIHGRLKKGKVVFRPQHQDRIAMMRKIKRKQISPAALAHARQTPIEKESK